MFVGEQHSAAKRVSTFTDARHSVVNCASMFVDGQYYAGNGASMFVDVQYSAADCMSMFVDGQYSLGNDAPMFEGEQHSAGNGVSTFIDAHYSTADGAPTFANTQHSQINGAPTFIDAPFRFEVQYLVKKLQKLIRRDKNIRCSQYLSLYAGSVSVPCSWSVVEISNLEIITNIFERRDIAGCRAFVFFVSEDERGLLWN